MPLLQVATVGGCLQEVVTVSVIVDEPVVARVCAIDIGKATLVACVRVPHESAPGRRAQQVRELSTDTRALLKLVDWLRCQGVELVAMEATSDYWKPVFYLLEAQGFTCWLLNARHVKNVPGRPKTDKLDAVWLAKVIEAGMCRPSLVHPAPIRRLRDLTRYRRTLVRERTREKARLEKVLEDAQIKLDSVITDLLGVSGREMLEAMVAGERNPAVLAQMARGPMRAKLARLHDALTGSFDDHHALLCATMLRRIDALTGEIATLDLVVTHHCEPYAETVRRLDEIPGVGLRSAEELIAEIGVDMSAFPTAAQPGVVGEIRAHRPTVRGHQEGRLHRQGQPLVGGHPRGSRRRPGPHPHLPRRPLPPAGPPPREEAGTGRSRQLGPDHSLAPALGSREPLP